VPLIWRVMRKQEIYLLYALPLCPLFDGIFGQAANYLIRKNYVQLVHEIAPSARRHYEFPRSWIETNLFPESEPWQIRHYGFDRLDRKHYAYALPFKKVVATSLIAVLNVQLIIDAVYRDLGRNTRIHGLGCDLKSLYRHLFEGQMPSRPCGLAPLRILPNFILTITMMLFNTAWIVARITPFMKVKTYKFAMDFIEAATTLRLMREILGDPKDGIFFFRNKQQACEHLPHLTNFRAAAFQDAQFGPVEGLLQISLSTARLMQIFFNHAHQHTRLYFAVSKFPFIQVMFRGIFNKYQFPVFLARDDYNVESIFRTWELRQRNRKSLGIAHGSPWSIEPPVRYLDFDTYYVFGAGVFKEFYLDRFPEHMKIREIGCYGLSRKELAAFLPVSPGCECDWRKEDKVRRDIACFTKPHLDGTFLLDGAIELAHMYPDRKVWVKIKVRAKDRGGFEKFSQLLEKAPSNLIYTETPACTLFKNIAFAISGGSTVVEEMLSLGIPTYVIDTYPDDFPFYWRHYEEFCLKSCALAITNIKDHIEGVSEFPWDKIDGVADLSGHMTYDKIREDSELPPLQVCQLPDEFELALHEAEV